MPCAARVGRGRQCGEQPADAENHDQFSRQWAPELYDLDEVSNELLFRGLIPDSAARASSFATHCQWSPRPIGRGGTKTGLGDLNIIDLFPFGLKQARMEIAVGSQFTLPTATNDVTGPVSGRRESPCSPLRANPAPPRDGAGPEPRSVPRAHARAHTSSPPSVDAARPGLPSRRVPDLAAAATPPVRVLVRVPRGSRNRARLTSGARRWNRDRNSRTGSIRCAVAEVV